MKILLFKNNYSLNYNKEDFDFYQQKISDRIAPADSVEIVQNVMKELEPNTSASEKNKMFFKIGKIFENAGSFQNAKSFYEKIKQNIPLDKTKKHQDIDFDIERVKDKTFEQYNQNGWEA